MLTLTSWNLLADCHVRPSWYPLVHARDLDPDVRWPRVLAALAASTSDILCLQEVPPSRLASIRAALSPRTLVHSAHLGEGVAIASRLPFLGAEEVRIGRKSSLVLTLVGGIRVACVHLSWAGAPPTRGRRPGVEQLRAVLSTVPDIITGDFNSFPGWPERHLARAAGYADIGPAAPTCNINRWLQPLDAVFVRPPWQGRALDVERIEADTPMPSARFPSDHLPVSVEAGKSPSSPSVAPPHDPAPAASR